MTPGDLVIILQQKEHPVFKRDGHDLFMEQEISLYEALCGFSITITHLDNRILLIKSEFGEIIKPGDIKQIEGEGMPIWRKSSRGKLKIKFSIKFPSPNSITPENAKILEKIIPSNIKRTKVTQESEYEEVKFSERLSTSSSTQFTNNEFDEDDHRGPHNNCTQQ